MMSKTIGAVALAIRESFSRPSLVRVPEPPLDIDAFDEAGGSDKGMQGIYHFNAWAIHALAPEKGTVVDLGCGSGRFLAALAQRRPDLSILGIDLDPEMLKRGRQRMKDLGMENRVELIEGIMTSFARLVPASVSVVSALFCLHHLPTVQDLRACVREISSVRDARGTGVWLFDHARPKNKKTAILFPEIFTPHQNRTFKKESTDSLMASWSFEELSTELSIVKDLHGSRARILPLYQIHWAKGRSERASGRFTPPADLATEARRTSNILTAIFSGTLPSLSTTTMLSAEQS